MDANAFPIEITNEDGTSMDFNRPRDPLKEKWDKLYPPTQQSSDGSNCEGYKCLWCDKCQNGEYWKIPEDDLKQWKEYQEQIVQYHKIHNPSLYVMLTGRS